MRILKGAEQYCKLLEFTFVRRWNDPVRQFGGSLPAVEQKLWQLTSEKELDDPNANWTAETDKKRYRIRRYAECGRLGDSIVYECVTDHEEDCL